MFLLIYFYMLFNPVYSENQLSKCLGTHPFRQSDSTCSSFEEVCIKKDNEECANFMNTCKQCPPSNYTILMLSGMLAVSKSQQKSTNSTLVKLESMTNEIEALKNLSKNLNLSMIQDEIEALKILSKNLNLSMIQGICLVILLLLFGLCIVLVLDPRFHIIERIFGKPSTKNPNPHNSRNPTDSELTPLNPTDSSREMSTLMNTKFEKLEIIVSSLSGSLSDLNIKMNKIIERTDLIGTINTKCGNIETIVSSLSGNLSDLNIKMDEIIEKTLPETVTANVLETVTANVPETVTVNVQETVTVNVPETVTVNASVMENC